MNIYNKSTPPVGFYVYAYLRKDGTPYYIGKGLDKRARAKHLRSSPPTDSTRIVILEHNLTDIGALALERRMIAWYGRKDLGTGILRNLTDGGDGSAGATRSEQTKRAIGIASKIGRKRKHTTESKKQVSARHAGKTVSNVTRTKISTATKGIPKPLIVSRVSDRKAMSGVSFAHYLRSL